MDLGSFNKSVVGWISVDEEGSEQNILDDHEWSQEGFYSLESGYKNHQRSQKIQIIDVFHSEFESSHLKQCVSSAWPKNATN
jgi:hypothetical protein